MKKNVVVTFGSCGLDIIVDKNTRSLIYQEEGRKNSHQAVAAKRAGAESILISFVGDDEIGKFVLDSLIKCGMDPKYIQVVQGAKTEVNTQLLDRITKDYDLERGPAELSQNYQPEMIEEYKDLLLSASCINLVSKQPKDFLISVIHFAYENKIPTYLTVSHKKFDVDVAKDVEVLKKVTYIVGNYQEIKDLTKMESIEEIFNNWSNVIMTKGGDGVYFTDEKGNICHEEAVKAKEIVETNGAGDTFIGNFMVFRNENQSMKESVRRAMCASTIEISKMGVYAAMPYRNETDTLFKETFKSSK